MLTSLYNKLNIKKFVFVLLFCVVIFLLINIYNSFTSKSSVSIKTQTGQEITFGISSLLDGYKINNDSQKEAFSIVLDSLEYGITWFQFIDPKSGQIITPDEFNIVFVDTSKITNEDKMNLFDTSYQDDTLVVAAKTELNTTIFTYKIFFDPQFIAKLDLNSVEHTFNSQIIRAIYLSSELNKKNSDPNRYLDILGKAQQSLKNKEKKLVKLQTSYLFEEKLEWFLAQLIPQTYAQGYCTGDYKCFYKSTSNCTCSDGSGTCIPTSGSCGSGGGGTCNCQESCSTTNWTSFGCSGGDETACFDSASTCSGDQYCNPPGAVACNWSEGNNCPAGQIFCGGGCGCMPNTQTCNYWIQNNCVPEGEPPPPGGGGQGQCEGLNLNCGQICEEGAPGSGECTADMQSCGYLPGVPYLRCLHTCCTYEQEATPGCFQMCNDYPGGTGSRACTGGGGGWECVPTVPPNDGYCYRPDCRRGIRILGSAMYQFGIPESGSIRYEPQNNANPPNNQLSILPGAESVVSWEGTDSSSYYFSITPESSDLGNYWDEGTVKNIEIIPPVGFDCSWVFDGNNPSCPHNSQSGTGCEAQIQLCDGTNPGADWETNFINWTFTPDVDQIKSCSVTLYGDDASHSISYQDVQAGNLLLNLYMRNASTAETARVYVTTKESGSNMPTSSLLTAPFPSGALLPGGSPVTSTQVLSANGYFYEFTNAGCTAGDGQQCSALTQITDLPPGDYYFNCNLESQNPLRCTGNPWYLREGLGGLFVNNTWQDCHTQPQPPTWDNATDNIPLSVTCTPDCATNCGGTDGCGGTCPNTDAGTPNVPSLTQPVAGNYNMTNRNNQITATWQLPVGDTKTDSFELVIYEQGTFGGNHETAFNAGSMHDDVLYAGTFTRVQLQHIIANIQNENQTGLDLIVAIRGLNNTCADDEYSGWVSHIIGLTADISGTFYEYAGACSGTPAQTINLAPPNTSTGTIENSHLPSGTNTTGSVPGTTYTLTDVPYNPTPTWGGNTVSLDITNSDPSNNYVCACFPGGTTSCQRANTISPNTNTHFYLTNVDLSNGPWWKAKEGNIYGAESYASNVPDTASTYLITRNDDANSKSAGIPLSGGTVSAGTGWFTEYDGAAQPRASSTTHTNMVREDYAYLSRAIDLSSVQTAPATINTIAQLGTGTVYDDTEIFFRSGDFTVDFATAQNIPNTRKIVIFVDGNATLSGTENTHVLSVASGGYFSIIASGDIIFDDTVGNTCAYPTCTTTDTTIDGVYVASNQLIIEDDGDPDSPDNMFVGEGTFVGWQGIDLRRTFDNSNTIDTALNNTYPTEQFNFRPDFNQNTPEILRRPNLVWQEVN